MKKAASNLLLSLAALLLALGAAEVISRVFFPPPQRVDVTFKPESALSASKDKKPVTVQAHPDEGGVYKGTPTGKRLRPNRHIVIENHRLSHQRIEFTTNSLGYRNSEIGEKRGTRILFLGDSVTFQDFLNEQDTFVRRIEMQARGEGRDWETINAGVGAISLKTELAILQETGIGLHPDIVVLDFYLNDFQESRGVHILQLPWLLQHSTLAYHLVDQWNQWRGRHFLSSELQLEKWEKRFREARPVAPGNFNESPEAFNQMLLDYFHDIGAAWTPEAWQHMEPLFREMKRLADEQGFQLVIVGFPIYQQVYTEYVEDMPQQQLKRVAEELGIPVLDLLPAFRKAALESKGEAIYRGEQFHGELFYDQCHHTPAGSALVANEIYNFLTREMDFR